MIKNILLTGATGFLGKHLTKLLYQHNYNLTCLIRSTSNVSDMYKDYPNLTWIVEEDLSQDFYKKIDCTIHAATSYGRNIEDNSDIYESNVELPNSLLSLADSNRDHLFINLDSFYTDYYSGNELKEYVDSKYVFREKYLFSPEILSKVVNLRVFHMYGPQDKGEKFIPMLIKKMIVNDPLIELGNGGHYRDYIYVRDVVDAIHCVLMNSDNLSRVANFDVGSGIVASINQLSQALKTKIKSKTQIVYDQKKRNFDCANYVKANLSGLSNLGWCPLYTLDEGLSELIRIENS